MPLEPVEELLIFVSDEVGFAERLCEVCGEFAFLDIFGFGFGAGDWNGFTAAIKGQGRIVFVVAGAEHFAVECAVAWSGSAVFNGGVSPEREIFFRGIELGKLSAAERHCGVGAIDGFQMKGFKARDAGFIKFFIHDVGERFLGFAASQMNRTSYLKATRLPLKVFLRAKALQAVSEMMKSG